MQYIQQPAAAIPSNSTTSKYDDEVELLRKYGLDRFNIIDTNLKTTNDVKTNSFGGSNANGSNGVKSNGWTTFDWICMR